MHVLTYVYILHSTIIFQSFMYLILCILLLMKKGNNEILSKSELIPINLCQNIVQKHWPEAAGRKWWLLGCHSIWNLRCDQTLELIRNLCFASKSSIIFSGWWRVDFRYKLQLLLSCILGLFHYYANSVLNSNQNKHGLVGLLECDCGHAVS